MNFPEWIKHYGGPGDPFLRIVETFKVVPCSCGKHDTLEITRVVTPRAYALDIDAVLK